jgi:hypothetical protein
MNALVVAQKAAFAKVEVMRIMHRTRRAREVNVLKVVAILSPLVSGCGIIHGVRRMRDMNALYSPGVVRMVTGSGNSRK